MQEINRYFDVVINNNSYYTVESSTKPDSAIKTLAKIEKVLKNKMEYDATHQDAYSSLSLQDLAAQIHTGYTKKQAKLHHIFRRLFSHEDKVAKLHTRIENYIAPPSALPLPQDMLNVLGSYLNNKDLGALSQLNRTANKTTEPQIVTRAREYGYEGSDIKEARLYMKELFSEVKAILKKRKYRLLQNFSPNDPAFKAARETITSFLSPEKIAKVFHYEDFFKNRRIFQYLSKCLKDNPDPQFINKIMKNALHWAAASDNDLAVRFLLDNGADVNLEDLQGHTPLTMATWNGNTNMVEMLLQRGADVNFKNQRGETPLALAARWGNADIIKILLGKGADPRIPDNYGYTPFYRAVIPACWGALNFIYPAYLIYKASKDLND